MRNGLTGEEHDNNLRRTFTMCACERKAGFAVLQECNIHFGDLSHTSLFTYPFPRSTKLFYMVNVKPKGPVPVGALEWRIKEDVPTNLRAVKVASEKLPWDCEQDQAALAGGHISLLISEESCGDVTFTYTNRKLLHKTSELC
jgi:hypothetical protein